MVSGSRANKTNREKEKDKDRVLSECLSMYAGTEHDCALCSYLNQCFVLLISTNRKRKRDASIGYKRLKAFVEVQS